jgi:PAS domain S-box-containing protein
MEKRYLHKDGHVLWGLTNVALVQDADGQPLLYVGQVQDITERKQADEALRAGEKRIREAQQRLQHVITSSPAVLFTLACEGGALQPDWISENVQEMLGHPAESFSRSGWWYEHVHPDDLHRVTAQVIHNLFTLDRVSDEFRFRHQDKTYRWIRNEMRLLRDPEGNPLEVVGSWSDITEHKALEDQFRQAQKMEAVGQLAGGIAHDFNNLLAVINGYGEILLDNLPVHDPNRDAIVQIAEAGNRAAALTRQLLVLSRKAIVEPKVLDLRVVVADMDRMLRRIIGEDISLVTRTDPELGAVKADLGQLEQVLLNLAVNARDAMPQGGRLTIEVRNAELDETYVHEHPEARPGPCVLLAASDTGCGMDASTAARIWEPFFTTKGERGTGLGLATVYGIVKQSGGHIAVYSEVGSGTVFKIYLPREETRPTEPTPPSKRNAMPKGTETILLAEDEDAVRGLTHQILEVCGYTILEARNGIEALQVAEEHHGRLDLLITDVVMPQSSGRELAHALAEKYPEVKILFVSGYTDDAVVRHGILAAEVEFLQKPFSPAVLARKVREILDRP